MTRGLSIFDGACVSRFEGYLGDGANTLFGKVGWLESYGRGSEGHFPIGGDCASATGGGMGHG